MDEVPHQENPFHAQAGQMTGGMSKQLNRDSRLDALCRQANEIEKMAAIMRDRSFQLVERLDGPRPQNTRGEECAVEQPGYINNLQSTFNEMRLSLEATNEFLNELDSLI
jgi:hypothetical protein